MEDIHVSINLGTRMLPSLLLLSFLNDLSVSLPSYHLWCCLTVVTVELCDECSRISYIREYRSLLFNNDYCTAVFIVLYETQFPSSLEARWEQHLPSSITREEGIVLYEWYFIPYSLQHIADAPHLYESILPPSVARVLLPQLCSFLLLMWKSIK